MPSDGAAVVSHCRAALGAPEYWPAPDGYPDSLGLCTLDAVWSIGVRYGGVENVLSAYRALRRDAGERPERDDVDDVAATIDAVGGPEAFANVVRNRQRTSTRNGILKSEAVLRACRGLAESNVHSAQDLREACGATLEKAKARWRAVPGQRSGVSWRYLLLLAGRQEVKPDRMLIRFVAAALGRETSADEAATLVMAAADSLGTEPRLLDHRIWRFQSGRG
jgi:hypothetical protein